MSSGELILTTVVAMIAFGPSKLPLLAKHLAKFIQLCSYYQQKIMEFWQLQLNEQQLSENLQKAKKAEESYRAKSPSPSQNPDS